MKSFLDIAPVERWTVLDRQLADLRAVRTQPAVVDPSAEVSVAALGEKHGIGERSMVNRLRALGGKPYQLGSRWFIGQASLVFALETAEEESRK